DGLIVPAVAPGLPSELLRRRPDVASAEANLLSAHANLEAARTAFLPAVTLNASAGLQYPALAAAIDSLPGLGFGTVAGAGLVVTDAERTLYAARDQLADVRRARLAASVALFKALGGGTVEPAATAQ